MAVVTIIYQLELPVDVNTFAYCRSEIFSMRFKYLSVR